MTRFFCSFHVDTRALACSQKNPVRTFTYIALATSFLAFGVSFAQDANDPDCQLPQLPSLPAKLATESDLETHRLAIKAFIDSSAMYRQCIAEFARDNEGRVSEAQRLRLRALHERSTELEKSVVERWNRLYTDLVTVPSS